VRISYLYYAMREGSRLSPPKWVNYYYITYSLYINGKYRMINTKKSCGMLNHHRICNEWHTQLVVTALFGQDNLALTRSSSVSFLHSVSQDEQIGSIFINSIINFFSFFWSHPKTYLTFKYH